MSAISIRNICLHLRGLAIRYTKAGKEGIVRLYPELACQLFEKAGLIISSNTEQQVRLTIKAQGGSYSWEEFCNVFQFGQEETEAIIKLMDKPKIVPIKVGPGRYIYKSISGA